MGYMAESKKSLKNNLDSKVVTSASNRKTFKTALKQAVILVVIVILALAAWLLITHNTNAKKTNSTTHVKGAQPSASDIATNGQYAQAQTGLDNQLSTVSKQQQAAIYIQKAVVALNVQQFNDALQFAQKADDLSPTANTAYMLALANQSLGDKQHAIENYQKAIDRMTSPSELQKIDIKSYQAAIKALQG